MYSPKIAEDLIPMIYLLAQEKNQPMTQIVDQILRKQLLPHQTITGGQDESK